MAELGGLSFFVVFWVSGEACALCLPAIEPDWLLPLMALTAPRPLQVRQIRKFIAGEPSACQ
jgi:hypothetical protein